MEPFNQTLITNPRVYDPATGNALLEAANNLSDVDNAATARDNLGVTEYLAPKATAGVVRFDGVVGYASVPNLGNFGNGTNDLPFSGSAIINQKTSNNNPIFGVFGTSSATREWSFQVELTTGLLALRLSDSSSSLLIDKVSSVVIPQNKSVHVAFTYDGRGGADAADGITLYLNGEDVTGTSTNDASYVAMENTGQDFWFARGSNTYGDLEIRDAAIFNRALSATEVTDLYRNGLAGIADADRWAWATYPYSNWEKYDTNSGYTVTSTAPDSLVIEKDGTSVAARARTDDAGRFNIISGKTYRVEFDLVVTGDNPGMFLRINDDSNILGVLSSNYTVTWADGHYVFDVVATASSSEAVFLFLTNTNSTVNTATITNFKVTGAIAAYPMDEGIGYQLHDISSNHYDGLLSTSGFTHLLPKTEGKIRFSNLNIGNTTVDLLAAGRDILPGLVVLRDAIFYENTPSTLLLSHLTLKRNNGGSFNGNHIYTDAINVNLYAAAGAIPLFADQQSLNFRRIQLGSTNSSATDISGVINYQKIEI